MDTLLSERSLHRQLAKRVEVEEYFKRTGRRLRKKHWLLRHERFTIRPTLKLALRAAGLYAKGRQNAVEPVIRGVTLTFPHLPAAFHGYKILHLSDFHIDGVDGLTEVLEERLSELR